MFLEKNLRYLRERMGETQNAVAEAIGVSSMTISRYESGVSKPDIMKLSELADYYGVSVDLLLFSRMYETPLWARNLQFLMEKHSLDEHFIADVLNVSLSMARKYVKGFKLPDKDALGRFAEYMNIRLEDLFDKDLSDFMKGGGENGCTEGYAGSHQ